MTDRPYIAPARRRTAQQKRIHEDGGHDGFAVYTETDTGISVAVHPRTIRAAFLKNINDTRND